MNPPLKEYPAHLHINIAAGCRRMGIGSLLMESYLAYLREKGVRGGAPGDFFPAYQRPALL